MERERAEGFLDGFAAGKQDQILAERENMKQFDIDHPAVEAGVKALFGQHPERGGQERQQAVFAVLQAAVPLLDGSQAPEGQMFFDHGSDSFLAEVGQILRIECLDISIDKDTRPIERRVRIKFNGYEPNTQKVIILVAFGRSYGECLYKIRNKIREETGR